MIPLTAKTADLTEYRFTFGVQYPRVEHPTFPAADGRGWLSVFATTREEARALAVALLGREWAFDYQVPDDTEWDRLYPKGELHRIVSVPLQPGPRSLGQAQHESHDLARYEP